MPDRHLRDVGGTRGGIGEFVLGLVLVVIGTYMLMSRVVVTSGLWSLFGFSSIGVSLVPFFLGIVFLFINGRSVWGWVLTGFGAISIFAGVLTQMRIIFMPTPLYDTLLMLAMMAAGIGLIVRSLRIHAR